MIKTIFMTISATLIVVTFVVSTFLNGILGLFGLTSTSVETLNSLKNAKHSVENLKKRHKAKKLSVSKKYVKRASKKIASSALAAATIGTAGVVVIIAGLEASDYCEDEKELNKDENILYGKNKEFNNQECLDTANENTKQIIQSVKETVPKVADEAWEKTKNYSSQTLDTTKRMGNIAWQSSQNTLKDLWKKFNEYIN
jgi:cytochrome c biogenesis factor|tara:strand:- start:1264 stop:1860 length:597 start_codon:yes stop_codon:yes gene_type:complete